MTTSSLSRRFRNVLPGSDARTARAHYDAAVSQAHATWLQLDISAAKNPADRARNISSLAAAEQQMADTYSRGYGISDPDADTVTRMHTDTALLLTLLASTSAAAGAWSRGRGQDSWETAFGSVLDDLTNAAHHPKVIAELLTRLYFPVCRLLGGDVAETVNRLETAIVRSVVNADDQTSKAAA